MLADMWTWVVLGVLVAALCTVLGLASIQTRITWASDGEAHQCTVRVRAPLGVWRHRWHVRHRRRAVYGAGRWSGRLREAAGAGQRLLRRPPDRRSPPGVFLRGLVGHIVIDSWRLDLTLGAGDAFATACACGATHALLGAVTAAALARLGGGQPPRVRVHPDYAATRVRARAQCIAHIRMGHLIGAALAALWAARGSGGGGG